MNICKNDRLYRFCKFDEESLQEVRVIRINNEDSFSIKVTKGQNLGEVKKVSGDHIAANFTKLNPDATIEFMVVEVTDRLKDVMVTVTKKNTNIPHMVCRQSANDLFSSIMNPESTCMGVCVSRDTCPNGVSFDDFLVNTKVLISEKISYYIGDSVEYILSLLKHTKEYNDTLMSLFRSHALYKAKNNKYIAKAFESKVSVDGYCKTIEDLLSYNNFEYDLNSAFGIVSTIFDESHIEGGTLSIEARTMLSQTTGIPIDKSLVLEYDKDIDLEKIKRRYILISLKNKKVYVVAYTLDPSGVNPALTNKDGSINIADSMRAFDKIAFNKEKYQK